MRFAILGLLACLSSAHAQLPSSQLPWDSVEPPITVIRQDLVYAVNRDGSYVLDVVLAVRINTFQGVQQQAQTSLPYNESRQTLEVLDAYTETTAGEHIAVAAENIVTRPSPLSSKAPDFGDIKVTAIAFPQIKPGSVKNLHFRRTSTSQFDGHFWMLQVFAAAAPIESASLTLIAPEDLPLYVQPVDVSGGRVESNEPGTAKWVWTVQNKKAATPERNAVSLTDFSPRVAATTFASFREVAQAYLTGSADKARTTDAVKRLAEQITADLSDRREQAAAIYQWMASNIRFVEFDLGLGSVVPREADAVLETRYGDSKDQAVLLTALLAAKGVEASPVLINAQNSYWLPDVALPTGVFNRVITYIPEFDTYLDPGATFAPFGTLPMTLLGKTALVARAANGEPALARLPLGSSRSEGTAVTTSVAVRDDGSAEGESTIEYTGVMEVLGRSVWSAVPATENRLVVRNLMNAFDQWGEGTISREDPRNFTKPFVIRTRFALRDVMPMPGPGAFGIPLGVPNPLGIATSPQQITSAERSSPMLCLAHTNVETTRITLPAKAVVAAMPEPVTVKNRFGSYKSTYVRREQTIEVRRELVLNPPGAVCSPDDVRELYVLSEAVGRDLQSRVSY